MAAVRKTTESLERKRLVTAVVNDLDQPELERDVRLLLDQYFDEASGGAVTAARPFRERVSLAMADAGLTFAQLSRELDVSVYHLRKFFAADRKPNAKVALRFAKRFAADPVFRAA